MEVAFFLEQGIDDTCEFAGGCDDSLFWGEMFSFFEVIGFEGGVLEDAGHTHEVEGSSQVGVSSFGDSGFPFVFSGLGDTWVYSCVCDEVSPGFEVFPFCFTDEVDGKCFVYTGYGAENPEFFGAFFLDYFLKEGGEIFHFFSYGEESVDKDGEEFFFYRVIYPYGFIGKGDNFFYGDAGFCSAGFEYFSPYSSCFFPVFSYFSCGWKVGEEGKDSFTFEVDILDFGEEAMQFLFYLVLESCVFSCEFFSFSCDGFEFWGGGIREFSSVGSHEICDDFAVNFVGFGFSEGGCFMEVFDEERVNYSGFESVFSQVYREEVMVGSCGLYTDAYWFEGFKEGDEILEAFSGKGDCFLLDDFPAMVYDGVCKGIFAYVDAYVVHGILLGFLGVSGRFSFPLILHLHAGFLPNQLMGDREGGDITPFRVHRPKVHGIPSPCFVCVPQVSIMSFKHTITIYHNST